MRRAQQREAEEHFAAVSLLCVIHNKKNFSKMLFKISKFQIFNGFDENSKFKKITFKLFLKILKHIF